MAHDEGRISPALRAKDRSFAPMTVPSTSPAEAYFFPSSF